MCKFIRGEEVSMEILKVVKSDNERYELSPAPCACAGYEGYCAALYLPPPRPLTPPYQPPPFGPPFG